jgi:tyrosyl-tRNA synthetase
MPALLASAFGVSTSEARRGISQGAVRLDGQPVSALDLPPAELYGRVLQFGKRRFARVSGPPPGGS